MTARAVKSAEDLSFFDRLSRLSYLQACRVLGERGTELLRQGGSRVLDPGKHARLAHEGVRVEVAPAVVQVVLDRAARFGLRVECSACAAPCVHAGSALSLILEEKYALGLSSTPEDERPLELLGEEALLRRALAEREERSKSEPMTLRSVDPKQLWTDYQVSSRVSGRTYRVALRGAQPGDSFCTCPDFRSNGLGTCKHVLQVLRKMRRKFSAAQFRRAYRRRRWSVHVHYGSALELRLAAPDRPDIAVEKVLRRFLGRPIEDAKALLRAIRRVEALGESVVIKPDAEEALQQRVTAERLQELRAEVERKPARHPLRRELLKVELLPYQLEGVVFCAAVGRAVLADDMGLGKTIQAIGTAELLARETGIERVLVITPASVKGQWLQEIERFCDRSAQTVLGSAPMRAEVYAKPAFFTICNYEQISRDLGPISRVAWDLIVLDEGQRIKNWQSQTARVMKGLRSRHALVLSGTPLENRLDELYSVLQFVDDRRLGPAFRFFHRHRVVDENGRVLGYRNLDQLRSTLAPVLLRRTREDVLRQLPERQTEVIRIRPTADQQVMHDGQMSTVRTIVSKPFLTEMDLLRLQKALLLCRMAADSTYLVDKLEPGASSKLEVLDALLERVCAGEGRKTLLFSEWTTMLGLVEPILKRHGLPFVRLDGRVPQSKRQALVRRFRDDPHCKVFLCTNAGATGLNLQAAEVVINVDLPWNPAVLEQRIGRAHRMGQKKKVQVYLLVTEQTLEERMLQTLAAKVELFQAVLDPDSDVSIVEAGGGMDELRRKLEVLLGAQGETPPSAGSAATPAASPAPLTAPSVEAGGRMLAATFEFLATLLPAQQESARSKELAKMLGTSLREGLERDAEGRPQLRLVLPDDAALDRLATTLGNLLAGTAPESK